MTFYSNERPKPPTKLNTYLNNYNTKSDLIINATIMSNNSNPNKNQSKFIYMNNQNKQNSQYQNQYSCNKSQFLSSSMQQDCFENYNYSNSSEFCLKNVQTKSISNKIYNLNQTLKCPSSNDDGHNENIPKYSQNNNNNNEENFHLNKTKTSLKINEGCNNHSNNTNETNLKITKFNHANSSKNADLTKLLASAININMITNNILSNDNDTSLTEVPLYRIYTSKNIQIMNKISQMDTKKFDELNKFEELQKIGVLLRKALTEVKLTPQTCSQVNGHKSKFSSNSPTTSDYCSSSNNNSCMNSAEFKEDEFKDLAFDNFTYMSSIEDLNETNLKQQKHIINNEILKKSLKYIKRKDRLKKNQLSTNDDSIGIDNDCEDTEENIVLDKIVPEIICLKETSNQNEKLKDENQQITSNSDYEKRLKAIFRNKSFSRSLRRAKTVFYRNQRSKSLEDLSVEERASYLAKAGSTRNLSTRLARLSRHNSSSSVDSHSSATSNGLASDISSSYFHELNDWSPEFSLSDSDASEDAFFSNLDWENNIGNVALVINILFQKYFINYLKFEVIFTLKILLNFDFKLQKKRVLLGIISMFNLFCKKT